MGGTGGLGGQLEPVVQGAQASGLSANIEFVKGEVGDFRDHKNVTMKNVGKEMVTISGDEILVIVDENPSAVDNLVKKPIGGTEVVCAVVEEKEKFKNECYYQR